MERLIIYVVVLIATITSCKKSSEHPSNIPKLYSINLKIVGVNENNLLDSYSKEEINNSIKIKDVNGKIIASSLNILEIRDEKYVRIESSSLSNEIVNEIKYNISFNKSSKVELLTKWDYKNNNMHINQISIDNKEIKSNFIDTENPFYFYKVTIE